MCTKERIETRGPTAQELHTYQEGRAAYFSPGVWTLKHYNPYVKASAHWHMWEAGKASAMIEEEGA